MVHLTIPTETVDAVEYVTIAPADPTNDTQVIAAIRAAVTSGLAKAKHIGSGTAAEPDYAWELSSADELTELRTPSSVTADTDLSVGTVTGTTMEIESSSGTSAILPIATSVDAGLMSAADKTLIGTLPTANTNLTTGSVGSATANRSFDFDTHSLTINNLTSFTIDSAFESTSVVYSNGSNTVTIQPPGTITSDYSMTLLPQLPTPTEVSNQENYLTIDDSGVLSFTAAVGAGGGTNISQGTRTAVSVEVVSSTGSNGTLTAATDTQAGVLTAANKLEIDTISNKVEANLTTGTLAAATGARAAAFGSNALSFTGLTSMTIDSSFEATSVVLPANGNDITVTAPSGLAASYAVDLWPALPTAQQVSDNEHFVTLDDSGNLSFSGTPADVSITRGTLLAATANRSVDLGGFDLAFTNINDASFDCPLTADTYTGQAVVFEEGAEQITLEPPIGLSNTYSVKFMTALPSGAQVSADENFLRIDDQGQIIFSAAVGSGSGTNLSAGVVTGTTYEIVSSTGTNLVMPVANTDDAGLMSASQFDLVATISSLPTANLTQGSLSAATGTRNVDFGNQVVSFSNASAFGVSDGAGSTISYAAGDVNLTAATDVTITATGGIVNCSSNTVHVSDIDVGTGANKVTVQKPGALAAPYTITLPNGLPSAGDVTNGLTVLRIDDSGVMTTGGSNEVNIATGTVTAATGARSIDFGSFNLTLDNVSNFLVTNGSGTSIATASGDVELTASGDVVLATSYVNAATATVHVADLDLDGGVNNVTLQAPAALAAAYTIEWLDALPSVGDVASDLNYLRVSDTGKLTVGAGGGGGGGGSGATHITVADIAERDTLSPTFVGFTTFVESNQCTYQWNGSGWDLVGARAIGTATERAALSELPDDFVWDDTTDNRAYRYDSAVTPPWIQMS